MPFIPHTESEINDMLNTIGVQNVDDLFDEIPTAIRAKPFGNIPESLNEAHLARLMGERAAQDAEQLNFIGAGAYQHHIPAAVWDIVSRGEYMTAYTPYQAEASQGSLQLIYEYQTMMASLMGMEVSNASLYDGASALAEAILMAVRCQRNKHRVLVVGPIAPNYWQTIKSITAHHQLDIQTCTFDTLHQQGHNELAAVVIPQPSFLGDIQDVHTITDWAHSHEALVVGLVNPLAMALLTPPSQWGERGADIACGEGQPLGVPIASGGPYFGFLTCQKQWLRQMPGRIVGKTEDKNGKTGYCLTLQAREQHIRRSKATSNICTNQGLLVTAATIYMSLMGPEGLRRTALASHHNANVLKQRVSAIEGIKIISQQPTFHEFVIQLSEPVQSFLDRAAEQNIQAGFDLSGLPGYENCLLLCSTEIHNDQDHDRLAQLLAGRQ